MGRRPRPLRIAAAALCLIAVGCASRSKTVFVSPQADFSLIRRVAVLPLENLTEDPAAAEKVRQLLIIELMATGSVEVVDVGEVARGFKAVSVANPTMPASEEVIRLGKELKVEALVTGTVQEFHQARTTSAPSSTVALVFRMLDAGSGTVIWSSGVSKSGVGAATRLFGVGGESATERARKLIVKALKTLVD